MPLLSKVKGELDRMEKIGVVSKMTTLTDWCAGMVVVPKQSGAVRVCVDLTKLNKLYEENVISSHQWNKCWRCQSTSKLDTILELWHIELAAESKLRTTFITPYGHFCFNCLSFGITSMPEHFQWRMSEILQGLNQEVCLVDEILVYDSTQAEHDYHRMAALQHIKQARLTMSKGKCKLN